MSEPTPRRERTMLGVWTAIGIGLGAAIGVALDSLGIGVAIGLVLGLAIGTALDRRAEGS